MEALTINWDQWTAIATTVYAAFTGAALLGVLFAICQLAATNQARKLNILHDAYMELHSDDAKRDRRLLYDSGLDSMDDKEFQAFQEARSTTVGAGELFLDSVERIADQWHHLGLLADEGVVDNKVLFKYFHWPLLNCYRMMRRFIRWRQRAWNPRYGSFFVSLAAEFEDRYKREYGEQEFARYFGSRTLQDL